MHYMVIDSSGKLVRAFYFLCDTVIFIDTNPQLPRHAAVWFDHAPQLCASLSSGGEGHIGGAAVQLLTVVRPRF